MFRCLSWEVAIAERSYPPIFSTFTCPGSESSADEPSGGVATATGVGGCTTSLQARTNPGRPSARPNHLLGLHEGRGQTLSSGSSGEAWALLKGGRTSHIWALHRGAVNSFHAIACRWHSYGYGRGRYLTTLDERWRRFGRNWTSLVDISYLVVRSLTTWYILGRESHNEHRLVGFSAKAGALEMLR